MALPPANTLRSALLALPWLPSLGVLLAVSGTLVFLVGMTAPPLTLDPPLGMALLEAGQDPVWATAGLVPSTAVDQAATDHRSGPVTTRDRIAVDDLVPVLPGPDDQPRFAAASGCLETVRARSRPVESAELATIPLHGDPRHALMAMAAGHEVGSGMRSCPCLNMGVACPGQGRADSDDRIANALFAPTESRDARWDLIEMAGVQGGAWTRKCPCPVYIDNPVGIPR